MSFPLCAVALAKVHEAVRRSREGVSDHRLHLSLFPTHVNRLGIATRFR
jgi:hypothetical protein